MWLNKYGETKDKNFDKVEKELREFNDSEEAKRQDREEK